MRNNTNNNILSKVCRVSVLDSPHGAVRSRPDLPQVPVPLRNLPHGPVHLLPAEARPGAHGHYLPTPTD